MCPLLEELMVYSYQLSGGILFPLATSFCDTFEHLYHIWQAQSGASAWPPRPVTNVRNRSPA
jgi:hypothetical protein